MKPIRKSLGGCFAALALLAMTSTPAGAQALNDETRALALSWLNNDCGLGSQIADQLRRAASPALEAFFLDALAGGPDPAQMTELQQAAAQRYERRQELLKQPESLGLDSKDVEAARRISREEFIAQERRNFELRYRSQAVAGLGIVGDTKARTELQRLASDRDSPLKTSAEQALTRMRTRQSK